MLVLTGCSNAGGRHALQGQVTLDGSPVSDGYITFTPQPGTAGPSAGGPIKEGRYFIAAKDGTFAGTFRVEIRAMRATGSKVKRPPLNEIVDQFEQYLPARYNDQSELTVEVKAEENHRLDFSLQSDIEVNSQSG
jgi:hypothetical protein